VKLTERSYRTGKGKATKSAKEADYRAIFDNLMQDLLTVLFWPEWPAASFMLGVAMKYLASSPVASYLRHSLVHIDFGS
jgi:hypothetical protein